MLVGFHVEGYDHLILKALVAKLLDLPEATIELDRVEASGMGWHQVLETLPKALLRFYGKCCAMVVVGVDNDGNQELAATGQSEDPARPRHWLHAGRQVAACRFCQIEQVVQATRPHLHWLPNKPGTTWPIIVSVPVEMIESWLLVARAVTGSPGGSARAEDERRAGQKLQMYGRPEATENDVGSVALPLIRLLSPTHITQLRTSSRSFATFADQVEQARKASLRADCWSVTTAT